MIGSSRARCAFAVAMLLICGLGRADAGPTPAQKCAAKKLKAAGVATMGLAKCDGEGVGPTNDTCSAKALAKLTAKFASAELKGGCSPVGDLPVALATIARFREVYTVMFFLQGVQGADCSGDKLKAAGKAVLAKAKCHQKAILTGTTVDSQCLQTAADKLAAAIAKADLRVPGGCFGPAGGLEVATTACANQLRNGPSPTGCFDESREGLIGANGIAACAGTPEISFAFGFADPHCAPGWRVCRFDDDAVHAVSYSTATAFPGCYGFDAADNFDTCQACPVGTPVNQSGMGSDCGYLRPLSTSCLADGRVTVTPFSSLLGCGVGTLYSTTGVVCCDIGIPTTTTTTSTITTTTLSGGTTSTTTTTLPTGPGCCDAAYGGIPFCTAPTDAFGCSVGFGAGATFHVGWECDGASGQCAPTRSGAGVCCEADIGGCVEAPSSCPPFSSVTFITYPGQACHANTGFCDAPTTTTTTTLPPSTHCCNVNLYSNNQLLFDLGCFDQASSDGSCPLTLADIGGLVIGSDPGAIGFNVCNSATGRCDLFDAGPGTCCQVSGPGVTACADTTATGLSFCSSQFGYTLIPNPGTTCTYAAPGTYTCQ